MPAIRPGDTATSDVRQPVSVGEWMICGRVTDHEEPRSVVLSPLPFQVGRRSGLSLSLPRPTISGLHAEFYDSDGTLFVADQGSTNGTFVNGERLTGPCPLRENDLVQFADVPFRVSRDRLESASETRCQDACDQALAIVQFDRLCSGDGLVPAFQPIVDMTTGETTAFESLARSRLIGLETPEFMFRAAEQLAATVELSDVARRVSVDVSSTIPGLPHLFLNTHPDELASIPSLLESCGQLRDASPYQRITIEIHESAMTSVEEMLAFRNGLEALDMTLAFDDFGAGQARIAELGEVRPAYLKFDRGVIRNLHEADAARRRVVRGLVSMARDIGIVTLAEGVETIDERTACIEDGFEWAQGYLYCRPMSAEHFRTSDPLERPSE